MTIPFGTVTVRDHVVVCLADSVRAAGSAIEHGGVAVPELAAAFAETIRTAVFKVTAIDLGSPVMIDLDVVVDVLVNRGEVTEGDRARQTLIDRYTDAPEIVAAYLDGGDLAVEQLVVTWVEAGA